MTGHVIAIYTHEKQGLFGAQKAKGILQTTVKSYAPQKEFYTPKYKSVADKNSERPDLRSLIHWKPDLQTKAGEELNLS